MSRGKLELEFVLADTVISMPHPASYYRARGASEIAPAAMQIAAELNSDWDASNPAAGLFTTLIVTDQLDNKPNLPRVSNGGFATIGPGSASVGIASDVGTYLHELGHNLGLLHASAWNANNPDTGLDDDSPIASVGGVLEYVDPFDFMGFSSGPIRQDLNVIHKYQLGWITSDELDLASSSADFRIYSHTGTGSGSTVAGRRLGLVIPMDQRRDYWIGYNNDQADPSKAGGDFRRKGVQLRWSYFAGGPGGGSDTALLDVNPARRDVDPTSNGYFDAALTVGQSFTDPATGVTVTNLRVGQSSDGAAYAEVRVMYGTSAHAPRVELTASTLSVQVGQKVMLRATATDQDGGSSFAFQWSYSNDQTEGR